VKVWLDDERPAPSGWEWVKTPMEAMKLLKKGRVTELSLDHDLGVSRRGKPVQVEEVLSWLVKWFKKGNPLPVLTNHTRDSRLTAVLEKLTQETNAPKPRKLAYVGVVLDKPSDLSQWWHRNTTAALPPLRDKIRSHHMTVQYKPSTEEAERIPLGKSISLKVIGWAANDDVQAVVVKGYPSVNKVPHITVSTGGGTSPVEAQKLLAKGWSPINGPTLKGRLGVFSGGEVRYNPENLYRHRGEKKAELIHRIAARHTGNLYFNIPPTKLQQMLKEETDEKKRRAIQKALGAWRETHTWLAPDLRYAAFHPATFPQSGGAGFLFVQDGKMLLLKRSEGVSDPGKWGIPGGCVSAEDKHFLAAATRECDEECGTTPRMILLDQNLTVEKEDPESGYVQTYKVFVAKPEEPFEPELNWEHDEYGWFSYHEAKELPLQGMLWGVLAHMDPTKIEEQADRIAQKWAKLSL